MYRRKLLGFNIGKLMKPKKFLIEKKSINKSKKMQKHLLENINCEEMRVCECVLDKIYLELKEITKKDNK